MSPQFSLGLAWVQGFQLLETHNSCVLFVQKAYLAWKCLFSQVGKSHTLWKRDIRAWWWSHKIHKIKVWKLPPGKVYSTQWWNINPNRGLLWQATITYFPARCLLCIGQCRASAAQCSFHPACVWWGSVAWNSYQKCSFVCRSLISLENTFFTQLGNICI